MLSLVFLLIAACNAPLVWGEIKAFSGPLPATSSYVQYSSGYLVNPGYVDLSEIEFMAKASEPSKVVNIYNDMDDIADEILTTDDDEEDESAYETKSPTSSPTVEATLASSESPTGQPTSNVVDDATGDADEDDEEIDTVQPSGNITDSADTDDKEGADEGSAAEDSTDTDADTDDADADNADADVNDDRDEDTGDAEANEDEDANKDDADTDGNLDKDHEIDEDEAGDGADTDTEKDTDKSDEDKDVEEDTGDAHAAKDIDTDDEDVGDDTEDTDVEKDIDTDDEDEAGDTGDEDSEESYNYDDTDDAEEDIDTDDGADEGSDVGDADAEKGADTDDEDEDADEDEDTDDAEKKDIGTDDEDEDVDAGTGNADVEKDTDTDDEDEDVEEDEDEDTDDADAEDTDDTEEDEDTDDTEEDGDTDDTEEDSFDDADDADFDEDSADGDDYYGNEFKEKSEEGGGGVRQIRDLASGGGESVIDIVFFHEPTECAKTKEGCDWVDLGVGEFDKDGRTIWCCSEEAVAEHLCNNDMLGRMIIDFDVFNGVHRPILVPGTGDWIGSVDEPIINTKEGTGQYTLVMANCNDFGRNIKMNGEYIWKSKGGFLPGDLFDEFHFFTLVTIFYGALCFWYAKSMSTYRDSIIGIQKWILGTIILGLIEMFFKTTDYMLWNSNGYRSNFAMYAWIIIGVLKGAISRCLLVMVSLGWGVIRDTLGEGMRNIIILGLLYSFLAFAKDVTAIIFVKEVEILSLETEREIYDVFTVLTFMVAVIDVLFYMWILDGLNATMQYLESMNQSMKLKRFLRLRLILILSIFFGFVWSIFGIVDATMDTALLSEGQEWIVRAVWYINYGCVLVAIALLWKPDPRAKQFAYDMELPSVGDDMVLDTHIGSGEYDDDEDGVNVSYSDYRDDGKFTIGNELS